MTKLGIFFETNDKAPVFPIIPFFPLFLHFNRMSMLDYTSFLFNPVFGENTYVVYDETKECVIIDPGCSSPREEERLFSFIDSNRLKPVMVLNTHGHIDHIMGNAAVCNRYHVKAAASAAARPYFTDAEQQFRFFGLQGQGTFPLPEGVLHDGDIVKVGTGQLEVIATPGHTEGCISFYAEVEGAVFTGDALFCRNIGRTDMRGGDYERLCKSIRERLYHLPDDTDVLPGHGQMTSIGEEKDFNPFVMG